MTASESENSFFLVDQRKKYLWFLAKTIFETSLFSNETTKPWQMANRHGLLFCIFLNASAERMEF